MKRIAILISFVILEGVACSSVQTHLPSTATLTVREFQTSTPSSTVTPIPTVTPTVTLTPTSTLPPEQYPKLKDLVLTVDDLAANPKSNPSQIFIGLVSQPAFMQQKAIIKDLTQDLVDKKECKLDCSRQSWVVPGVAVYITMIREESTTKSLILSQEYFGNLSKNVWFLIPDYEDDKDELLSLAWIIKSDEYYQSLGTTHGAIYIQVVLYTIYPGDDFGLLTRIMVDTAEIQINKLRAAGIPPNP